MGQLKEISALFPFVYDVPKALFMNAKQFVLSTFNGEPPVSLK